MTDNKVPLVAILILNWNNYPDTKKCLESLDALTYPRIKIILVDNGSDDGSMELLQENYPEFTLLLSEHNLGFAGGINIGLRYILKHEIPYTLLLNNDTEVIQPDFLDIIVREIEADNEICAIGPKVERMDGTPDQVIMPFPTFDMTLRTSLGLYQQRLDLKQAVDSLTGCCVLVKDEAIRQAGLLDENYFMYVEETEWFFRMRTLGWKVVYFPVKSVIHKGATSSRKLESKSVYIERRVNVVYTLVKHGLRFQAVTTAILMSFLLLVRIILGWFGVLFRSKKTYPISMVQDLISAFIYKWNLAQQSNL